MARTKKTASVASTAPKIRGIDLQEVEARVTALDKAKRRSYDIFDIEQRVYNLEKNGGGGGSQSFNTIMKYSASSTWSYSKAPITAFDWIENSDMRSPNDAWCSNPTDNAPYLEMFTSTGIILKKIKIKVFSNYSDAWTGNIKITASEDGTTFVDLTENEFVNAPLQVFDTHEFVFSSNNTAYKYYRIQGASAFGVNNSGSCFFDQVEAFT